MAESLEATRSVLRQESRGLLARRNVVATGAGYKVTGGKRRTALHIFSRDPITNGR